MKHIDPQKLAAAPLEPEEAAKAAGLRYVDDSAPGFTRKKVGTGFGYRDSDGKVIRDPAVIKRIRLYVGGWQFGKQRGASRVTLPLVFERG